MRTRYTVFAAMLLATSVAHAQHPAQPIPGGPPPPPPPGPVYTPPAPPPPSGVSREQAIEIARGFAGNQGLEVTRVKDADLKGDAWRVKLVTHPKGKLTVEVDARTGQIVEVKEKVKGKKHGKHGD